MKCKVFVRVVLLVIVSLLSVSGAHSQVINSRFRALDYGQIMGPLLEMQRLHEDLEYQYAEMESYLLQRKPYLPSTGYLRSEYDKLEAEVNKAASNLEKYGYSAARKSECIKLIPRINGFNAQLKAWLENGGRVEGGMNSSSTERLGTRELRIVSIENTKYSLKIDFEYYRDIEISTLSKSYIEYYGDNPGRVSLMTLMKTARGYRVYFNPLPSEVKEFNLRITSDLSLYNVKAPIQTRGY